jgi:hypothetical protein
VAKTNSVNRNIKLLFKQYANLTNSYLHIKKNRSKLFHFWTKQINLNAKILTVSPENSLLCIFSVLIVYYLHHFGHISTYFYQQMKLARTGVPQGSVSGPLFQIFCFAAFVAPSSSMKPSRARPSCRGQ